MIGAGFINGMEGPQACPQGLKARVIAGPERHGSSRALPMVFVRLVTTLMQAVAASLLLRI